MLALELMFHIPGIRSILGYSGAFYPPVARLIEPPLPQVFLSHGDFDTVVPITAFKEAVRQLTLFNIHPTTHVASGLGHSIDMEGVRLGGEFLESSFGLC
jgi:phospholipase/carboxylesterase